MKNVEQRKMSEKARGAAAIIRCMSEELTEQEINQVIELKNSILKRVAKK